MSQNESAKSNIDQNVIDSISKLELFSNSISQMMEATTDEKLKSALTTVSAQVSKIFETVDQLTEIYIQCIQAPERDEELYKTVLASFDEVIATLEDDVFQKIVNVQNIEKADNSSGSAVG